VNEGKSSGQGKTLKNRDTVEPAKGNSAHIGRKIFRRLSGSECGGKQSRLKKRRGGGSSIIKGHVAKGRISRKRIRCWKKNLTG